MLATNGCNCHLSKSVFFSKIIISHLLVLLLWSLHLWSERWMDFSNIFNFTGKKNCLQRRCVYCHTLTVKHSKETDRNSLRLDSSGKVSSKGNHKKLKCLQELEENLLGMLEHYGQLFVCWPTAFAPHSYHHSTSKEVTKTNEPEWKSLSPLILQL